MPAVEVHAGAGAAAMLRFESRASGVSGEEVAVGRIEVSQRLGVHCAGHITQPREVLRALHRGERAPEVYAGARLGALLPRFSPFGEGVVPGEAVRAKPVHEGTLLHTRGIEPQTVAANRHGVIVSRSTCRGSFTFCVRMRSNRILLIPFTAPIPKAFPIG